MLCPVYVGGGTNSKFLEDLSPLAYQDYERVEGGSNLPYSLFYKYYQSESLSDITL